MTGLLRARRRIGVVVSAVAVVASGFPSIPPGPAPATASTASAASPRAPGAPPPPLSWPEPAPAVPTDVPAADGALAVPDDWAEPVPRIVREARTAPVRAAELVERRDATTAVWKNTDGTETVVLHSQPVHFQPPGAPGWEPIDVRVIPDPERPGGLRTTAGAWTARFAALQPGGVGGLELTTAAGPTRTVPDLTHDHAPVDPVVSDDGLRVTYADVWPGSDLRYTVTPSGLVQTIVINGPDCESFRFLVEGLGLGDGEVTGAQAGTIRLEVGEVTRGPKDRPSGKLAQLAMHVRDADPALVGDDPAVPGIPQDVELTVAGSWLDRALADDEGPVVIDAPSLVGPPATAAYRKVDGESQADADGFGTGVRVGHQPGEPAALWRSTIGFAHLPAVQGKQVLEARLWLAGRVDGNERTAALRVRNAQAGSSDGVAGDGEDWAEIEVKPGVEEVTADLSDLVTHWQRHGPARGSVGVLAADEDTSADSFVRFDEARLELRLNSPAPAVPLVAPAIDALATTSTTPTLTWTPVTDPDGDPVQYVAQLATGLDGDSGLVAASPPGTETSWPVPAGLLRDGGSYTWRVFASDGRAWTPSDVRRITVDRRTGSAPTDVVGPLATNLVTGGSTLTLDGPALATVRGDVGLRLVHDALAPATGLVGTYRADANRNTTIDDDDPIRLIRTDPQLSFAWNRPGAAAPTPGVPAEWFSVRWAGFVTLPAGEWQLGARAGDGVRISVDGQQVLDRWAVGPPAAAPEYQDGKLTGGRPSEIRVDYFQAAEDASFELWVRKADTPGQAFVVPASWLSPSEPSLPAGWSLDVSPTDVPYVRAIVSEASVTLVRRDGGLRTFRKTPGGSGYLPPPGSEDVVTVNPDGTTTVRTLDGRDLVFGPGGGLAHLASPADDRAPAAVVPSTDEAGRLTKLTDPVSGRAIRLAYAPSDGCPAPPAGLDPPPAGLLCQVASWDGTATDLFYRHGRLAYVRNPGDAYWGFGYDAGGRLSDVLDPVAVDASLAGLTEPAKAAHHVDRDDAGRVATVTRPEATPGIRATRTYTYTPVTSPAGELVSGQTTVTRSGLPEAFRRVAYDARGRLVADTDAAGQTTTFAWDADDHVVASDRPDGVRTTFRFDRLGQPVSQWGPAPATLFGPDGAGGPGVPHEQRLYDEGLAGQQVQYWANTDLTGPPTAHGWQPSSLSALTWDGPPGVDGLGADGWSARFGGSLVFPATGTYTMQVNKDDRARVFLDDQLLIDAWDTPTGWSPEVPVDVGVAGEAHRLRVDIADVSGPATLQLMWKPPGAAAPEAIPDSQFTPDFGLLTTKVDGDGVTTGFEYSDPQTGIGPHHQVAVRTTLDPAGLRLVATVGYEPPGVGHLRPIARSRPAGPETQATTGYYGDREERDNPCTRPADPANQAGLVQFSRGPDPDGEGPGQARVQEVVHDGAGRVVARRLAGDAAWTCTDYDARGRVTAERFPAVGEQPARTVTTDHSTPLKVTVSDEAGTLVTESNLWGQTTATVDVFGHRTTIGYDEQGRAVLSTGPGGALATSYDGADRVIDVSRDGQSLASGLVYDPVGQLTGLALGNGTAGALGYDPAGAVVTAKWTGPGGAAVTSDEVRRLPGPGSRIADRKVDGQDHHDGDDYVYDTARRLIDAWVPGLHASFQFATHEGCGPLVAAGADGNRTHYLREGGSVTCYCYDRADRLTAADTVAGSIRYDAHDNIDGVFGETRRYDAADRLVEIVSGPTTVAYRRDATGRIVERQVNGTVAARYGEGFTTDAADAVVESVVTLPGGVLVTVRPTGTLWSHPNAEGAVAAVTDQAATKLSDTLRYDPYGNLITGVLPDTTTGDLDHTPHGSLEHEPGLQPLLHQGTRQYSLTLGRHL